MRIKEFKKKLLSIDKSLLPGDSAHMEMTPYKKNLEVRPELPKLSAVMILVYPGTDSAEILLLKRADYQGVHSAQVSFPGGKKDETDLDMQATAIRELAEETGIAKDLYKIEIELSPLFIPPSNFMVHPFVAIADIKPEISIDSREAQYHFGIALNELLDDEKLGLTEISTSYGKMKDVPYFNLNNEIIWGATAAILNELKQLIKRE
jgi:8-oxo-dGTP pyrophosphatase MutT (NUDIX family)